MPSGVDCSLNADQGECQLPILQMMDRILTVYGLNAKQHECQLLYM